MNQENFQDTSKSHAPKAEPWPASALQPSVLFPVTRMGTGEGWCLLPAATALHNPDGPGLHHEGEVNANVTRWCHTLVSPASCCLFSRDTTSRNYYKTGFLPSSAALMSQEVVSNLGIGELLTEPNYFLTVFLTPLENKTPT